jgi:hypothetical protein
MLQERIYNGKVITIKDVPQYMYNLRPNCKDILRAYVRKLDDKVRYSKENPKKIKKWSDETYKRNSKKICEQTMKYYLANKEYLNKKNREWYWNNRDERLAYGKYYRDSHKEESKIYHKIHSVKPETKAKKKAYRIKWESIPFNNVRHKIQSNVNTNLRKYAEKGSLYKGDRHKDVDYNAISEHLLKLADEVNISYKEIKKTHQVDHIIPMYYYQLEEIHKAFNLLNLRWLPCKENLSRGNKLRPQDIKVIKTLPKEIYPKSWNGIIPKE